MLSTTITCSVCGHSFDPSQHPSCGACPLHQGCHTACCPNCGASNINPNESRLARWVDSLLKGKSNAVHTTAPHP